jgi:uncharacterized protein (DUF2236 family)
MVRRTRDWLHPLRSALSARLEREGGRHDEAAIYEGEPGDPGLAGGPGSLSWEIHGDLASLAVAGPAAILMEVMHPSVMHGVYTQSSYRTDTLKRTRNTLGYVLRTTFGSTPAATRLIETVKGMHARVRGVRPDGIAYCALDPELLAWVHTCIPWAVMMAFDRTRRPLGEDEKDRYLREQAVIGRMAGADWVPESMSELEEYVDQVRPVLATNQQTVDFIAFLEGQSQGLSAAERAERWVGLRASMLLMPPWARSLTGTRLPAALDRFWLAPTLQMQADLVRWAYPELPCVAIARGRATAEGSRSTTAPRPHRFAP